MLTQVLTPRACMGNRRRRQTEQQTDKQGDRQTDKQTERWRDRQTDEERPKPFSGQTNDLEKPNESKRTKEMRERKILENMKGKKGAAKRRSGERAVSWGRNMVARSAQQLGKRKQLQ